MTIIHANDPTTQFLSLLYNQREDIKVHITQKNLDTAARQVWEPSSKKTAYSSD